MTGILLRWVRRTRVLVTSWLEDLVQCIHRSILFHGLKGRHGAAEYHGSREWILRDYIFWRR